jgi:hypothetical protein
MTVQREADARVPAQEYQRTMNLNTSELGVAAHARLREDLIHPDPLLDCLVEVCRLHGHAASRASLSAGLPLPMNAA